MARNRRPGVLLASSVGLCVCLVGVVGYEKTGVSARTCYGSRDVLALRRLAVGLERKIIPIRYFILATSSTLLDLIASFTRRNTEQALLHTNLLRQWYHSSLAGSIHTGAWLSHG